MSVLTALVVFVAVLSVSEAGVSINNPFYCYATDWIRPQNQMHSVRTSYESIRRTEVDPTVSSCRPAKFWFVSRHGGRMPETPVMLEMFAFADSSIQADIIRNSDEGKSTMCRQDIELIRNWVRDPNITLEFESTTTEAGWTAMQNIGRRYQQFFPDLLPSTYDSDWFFFRSCFTQRSRASISAFADGLFGDGGSQSVNFQPVPEFDFLIRPIAFCPAFQEETAHLREQEAFEKGPKVQQMLAEVNRRLGFHDSERLNFRTIRTMFEWCRLETASRFELSDSPIGEASVWCAPFTIAHNEILEYYDDLGYYYFTGYGVRNRRLIENLNCGLIQDLLTHIQSGEDSTTARVFVTYSQMIQSFLVSLGALNDETTLQQFNLAQQSFRHWKTSYVTPNAANIVVVRYDCDDDDHDLLFLLNERPLHIPGCQPNGLCKASFILNRLQRFIGVECQEFFCTDE